MNMLIKNIVLNIKKKTGKIISKVTDKLQYLSAMNNINALRKEALSKFPDGLTLDEINAEIDAYRKGN